jgi:Fic family protein
LRIHQYLERHPFVSIGPTAEALGLSLPTITKAFGQLERLGILLETTGRQRGRGWVYQKYVQLLAQGTEPLPR